MKEALKKKWVEALRSGEFRQGKGKLRITDRYCCLGVLLEIDGSVAYSKKHGWHFRGSGERVAEWNSYFTSEYRRALNITLSTERILARMNDDGTPFDEIANYLETHMV